MSALRKMIEKLKNRKSGNSGYVTNAAELTEILKELTPLVPVGIDHTPHPMDARNGLVSVTVEFSFVISLDELDEIEKNKDSKDG